MRMSEIATAAHDPFRDAEISYRFERARRDYVQRPFGKPRHRRLRLPRRPVLHLPKPPGRPLAVS